MIFRVSVIIPNYNYEQFLCEAIEIVLPQNYPCREIIAFDNGSTRRFIFEGSNHSHTIRDDKGAF